MKLLNDTSHQDQLLTANEAAKILGIKAASLAQRRWRGDLALPYVKLGKVIRYKQTDLNSYIEKNTIAEEVKSC